MREQGQEPIRPAFGGGLEFNDVAIMTTGDDKIDMLVVNGMLPLNSPAVLAEQVDDKVFKLALAARARRVRFGMLS